MRCLACNKLISDSEAIIDLYDMDLCRTCYRHSRDCFNDLKQKPKSDDIDTED